MRKLRLTNGTFALVDDEDFDRLSQFNWYHTNRSVQRRFISGREKISVSLASEVMLDYCSTYDHADRNYLNNQKFNLRKATQSQNLANRQKALLCSSKYKGVCWREDRKKWRVQIKKHGVVYSLGNFLSEEDAAKAYDLKALELFGEFAVLNFPK